MTLFVPADRYETLLTHAREGAPAEICGVLGGTRTGTGATVETVRSVPNVADAPRTRYELDPERQLGVIEDLEARGEEIVGFYHSHPDGPPGPSATDRAQATWPDAYYVILSLAGDPSIGAWRFTGERFEDAPVEIRD